VLGHLTSLKSSSVWVWGGRQPGGGKHRAGTTVGEKKGGRGEVLDFRRRGVEA